MGQALSKATRATQALARAGIGFKIHEYAYDPDAERIGMQAAVSLGVSPRRVLKTLLASADGKPVCVLVPSDSEASMKRVAAAFGAKMAQMMRPEEAERVTGYHVGGISPFGQRRQIPIAIEQSALTEDTVFLNGGQRGLQVELAPGDAMRALKAVAAALIA